ncbi:hypothetical protein [Paracoccus sp. pheM1]|uniref:hypothetical protein n=1 Tax=Paracoccus sp. pheM1 TaxID=2831675 RepID=UPI001BDB860D|nr:hypothetical protein [Paracoccus sp. pheM1]MBT0779108.1 hypothetical protein [Paracoccus sp. pheM1]
MSPPIIAWAIGARCAPPPVMAMARGNHPEDHCERRHDDRPELRHAGADQRSDPFQPALALLIGEIGQQDAFLGHQPHQHDASDHQVCCPRSSVPG